MTETQLLGGRYALGETIGIGGMAEVFSGTDVRLGRDVAVKVLRADLARDPAFQARFRREAQSAASLNAPCIVSVYDTGEDNGVPYIVMEYVEGRTLRDILQTEGRLLPQRALEVAADICAALDVAHGAGIPLVIDNTLASPYLCRPFDHGADLVIHSVTKYLGGHGTTMGGIVVESGKFAWDNGNFPQMTEPSRGYHGVRFYETFGDFGFTMKARMETMRTLGPTLSPFSAFLLLQGIETLHLRMPRHCEAAMAVAKHLAKHPRVAWVRYPGLPGQPDEERVRRYLPKGAGGILTFGVRGGAKAGERVIESVAFLSHLANVGDAKSLIIHPASTTHRQLSEDEQRAAGVTPEMIRLSIGLESIDDILWDLDQALARVEAE